MNTNLITSKTAQALASAVPEIDAHQKGSHRDRADWGSLMSTIIVSDATSSVSAPAGSGDLVERGDAFDVVSAHARQVTAVIFEKSGTDR